MIRRGRTWLLHAMFSCNRYSQDEIWPSKAVTSHTVVAVEVRLNQLMAQNTVDFSKCCAVLSLGEPVLGVQATLRATCEAD